MRLLFGGRARVLASLTCVLFLALASGPARAADPAIEFMQRVAKDLIGASRTVSPGAFASVIQAHGDVPYIGLYSLGNYKARLDAGDKPNYYTGMVRFISRYAAGEASKYQVSHVAFKGPSRLDKAGVLVDSTVHLRDGTTYDVTWLLAKYGSTYRVRDAEVLNFWMTPFLRRLFENYVEENGGNVKALVLALNR